MSERLTLGMPLLNQLNTARVFVNGALGNNEGPMGWQDLVVWRLTSEADTVY